MALIKCPECEKEISDKAEICPHCGYPLTGWNDEANEILLRQCPDCGHANKIENTTCDNCGYPFSATTYTESKNIEDDDIPLQESGISIASLVCWGFMFVFYFINKSLYVIFGLLSLVLAIIAMFQKDKKTTCANIVLWINIIGTAVIIFAAFVLGATLI